MVNTEGKDYQTREYEKDSREVRKREQTTSRNPVSLKIRTGRQSGKRISDDLLDWNSEQQEALEAELDADYEEQLESEEQLILPHPVRVPQKSSIRQIEDAEEMTYLRKRGKEMLSYVWQASYKESNNAVPFVELRQPIAFASHLEEVFIKAREHFQMTSELDSLPIQPRAVIVHKEQSEAILGSRMERCVSISSSSIPNEIQLFHAHRLCCTATPDVMPPVNGWQSPARDEVTDERVFRGECVLTIPDSHCQLCNNEDSSKCVAFSCGHTACTSCWLVHAKQLAETRSTSITCIIPSCGITISESEASILYSDATIDIFRGFWWDALCRRKDAVKCHACPRILIPLTSSCTIAAECACGARTCARCGLREHLPLACTVYGRWAEMMMKEGITRSRKRYVRHRKWPKVRTTNCRKCGAVDTFAWKDWCDCCCSGVSLKYYDAPVKSNKELVPILRPRGRMMSGHFTQLLIDCESIDKTIAAELKQLVEEGVFLSELIKISHFIGTKTLLRAMTKMERQQLEAAEESLDAVLFAAMESGENPERNVRDLRNIMRDIRKEYSQYAP